MSLGPAGGVDRLVKVHRFSVVEMATRLPDRLSLA